MSPTPVSKIDRICQPEFAFWTNVVDWIIFVCLMELLSRIITKLWKADLWFCEFCKCEISRVRGDYPFTALAGVTIRIIRCWIKEFLCEHFYDNIIQYASYCIFNFVTWSFSTGFRNIAISYNRLFEIQLSSWKHKSTWKRYFSQKKNDFSLETTLSTGKHNQ